MEQYVINKTINPNFVLKTKSVQQIAEQLSLPEGSVQPAQSGIRGIDAESVVVQRYRRRMIAQNKNWLGIITGSTGSGKSYAALRLAEEIDPTFNIDRCVFTPHDFMRLFEQKKVGKGQIIIWDESGVSLGARDFATKVNKAINYYLQTFRSKNTGVIFTLPSLNMLDSQTRILAHTLMEPKGVKQEMQMCILKLWELQNNPVMGKTYRHCIKVSYNGNVYKLNSIGLKIPSVKLRHAYEKKKDDFVTNLVGTTLEKLDKAADKENKSSLASGAGSGVADMVEQMAEEVYKNQKKFKNHKDRITTRGIAHTLQLSEPIAERVKFAFYKKVEERKLLDSASAPLSTAIIQEHTDE